MYEVTRKGRIQVYRVGPGTTETPVSQHVDEAEAINAANNHGERLGGGLYRLAYPDKTVRVIIQGPSPIAPILAASIVSGSFTELDITLSVPSLGVAPPFAYELEESTSGAGGSFVVIPATFVGTPASYRRGGLVAGNTRHYRARSIDSADPQRVSVYSNVATATVPQPPAATWWPNWPTMQVLVLQGAVGQHLLDPTQHNKLADHEAYVIQGMNPLAFRLTSRITNIDLIKAQQNLALLSTKFMFYTSFQQALKDFTNDGDTRPISDLIESPTEGNPNWWMRRLNGAQIEAPFNPTTFWMVNGARSGLLNSLGETYQRARWRKLMALFNQGPTLDLLSRMSGFFQDDVHARMQTPMSVNNGAQVVTDPDFEQNGVAENITDFSAGAAAGCRKWCEGHLDSQSELKAQKPGFLWFSNSARCSTDYYDGGALPPLPLSLHPWYAKLSMGLQENIAIAGLGITQSASAYGYNGGGSLFHASRLLAIHQKMLLPDSQVAGGRASVVVHYNLIDRTPTAAEYELARFIFVLALLNERCSVSLSLSATKPLSLDECLLELGAPLATRSLGTLNEANVGYTQRTADASVGVARFYWVETLLGLALLRGDSPTVGVYPSADAAVACPLPSADVGFKWQRIDPSNYTNPKTGRSMRNQQPSVNTGADAGASVALKPYHAIVLRRVPGP